MTPADIIAEARVLIQDSRTPYRYSDTVLLGFVNQTLRRMSILRPDLFMVIGDIPTTANTVIQSCPADSLRLVEIFQIKNGDAVTEVNREVLDQMSPGWVNEAAGTPLNFMRHVRNPNKFFLYPRPTAGVVLVGEYAQVPPAYTLNQTIAALPDAYLPVAADGVVFLAESVDNEHVNSNRAKLFQDSFNQTLAAGLQTRTITDTEEGGMDPKQVI
jgi:hypothetical protein